MLKKSPLLDTPKVYVLTQNYSNLDSCMIGVYDSYLDTLNSIFRILTWTKKDIIVERFDLTEGEYNKLKRGLDLMIKDEIKYTKFKEKWSKDGGSNKTKGAILNGYLKYYEEMEEDILGEYFSIKEISSEEEDIGRFPSKKEL